MPRRNLIAPPCQYRPAALHGLRLDEVVSTIAEAPVPILATEELRIVFVNESAKPAFAAFPNVIGRRWPDFLKEYWAEEPAAEVIHIIENTLATGTPYSSTNFVAERASLAKQEQYDWEVYRILTADQKRMLLCYFVGPEPTTAG